MKAILKAPAMPEIAMIKRVGEFISGHPLHIGAMGAALSFLGCLLSADAMMWTGASIAMLSVKPSAEKGGER